MKSFDYTNGNVKEIRITCKSHSQVPIEELIWFQGNLAELSPESEEKLWKSIQRHGIFMAFSVWEDGGKKHIIDGHARLKTLQNKGYTGLVPVNFVMADSYDDAREKVLLARSQSNVTTEEGLFEFAGDLDWTDGGLPDLLDIPDINIDIFKMRFDGEVVDDPLSEWQGMPEFEQDGKRPFKQIIVRFMTEDDVKKFSELIGQEITSETKSLWHPKQFFDTTNKENAYK